MNPEVRNTPRVAALIAWPQPQARFFRQHRKHRSRFFFTGGIEKNSNETQGREVQ
jgi:hypothetical protein